MPRRKVQLVNGEFYHVIKRGIDGRNIFLDDEDKLRFINSLIVFNDVCPCPWQSRAFWISKKPIFLNYKPKEPLVEIHVFTLMDNHFHILVRQLVENGITKFMTKLGGYPYYFNKKYNRQGTLFQNRYKIKRIETEIQLKNNFTYIHTNPVEMIELGWKNWEVKNPQEAKYFLEEKYRWSSYNSYIGKNNFNQVVICNFFLDLFGGKDGIKKEIDDWINFKSDIFNNKNDKNKFQEIAFE